MLPGVCLQFESELARLQTTYRLRLTAPHKAATATARQDLPTPGSQARDQARPAATATPAVDMQCDPGSGQAADVSQLQEQLKKVSLAKKGLADVQVRHLFCTAMI